ncbi:hypothetical protein ADK43_06145 [Streptomyces rimosus subsp. rimosus]|nr:hypothetical protein ADK43_06145 [Streptomyces rimosus subsp. rimosus]
MLSVRSVELVAGDEIPAWLNGTVNQAPLYGPDGYVTVEISGTDVDIDPDERLEVLRFYGIQLPAAFVAAVDICWPDQRPAPLPERRACDTGDADSALPVWLSHLTYAQTMAVRDLAALVGWECLHADAGADDSCVSAGFADAARAACQALLHPVDRARPAWFDR